MSDLAMIRAWFRYSDWANGQLLRAATELSDEQLDRPFDMGVGSLRRTLLHIYNGEHVWLNRWQGRAETRWPAEDERVTPAVLAERFSANAAARNAWLATVQTAALAAVIPYRDSKGSLFKAALVDMILQMGTHSLHHRAQAVNMLRRLGGAVLELDYMMWVRQPAAAYPANS